MAGHKRLSIGLIRVFIALWNLAFIRLHGDALGNLAFMLANNSNDALRSSAHSMSLRGEVCVKRLLIDYLAVKGGQTIKLFALSTRLLVYFDQTAWVVSKAS